MPSGRPNTQFGGEAPSLRLLTTLPGIGRVLGLTILYEIHGIARFPSVQDFASYSRL